MIGNPRGWGWESDASSDRVARNALPEVLNVNKGLDWGLPERMSLSLEADTDTKGTN